MKTDLYIALYRHAACRAIDPVLQIPFRGPSAGDGPRIELTDEDRASLPRLALAAIERMAADICSRGGDALQSRA